MTFFRTVSFDASQAPQHADVLSRLRARAIDGVVVKRVIERELCDTICAELAAERHGLIKTEFPAKFAAFFYGANLNLAHPDLRDYFAATPGFRDGLARLAGGRLALEPRVTALLSSLDEGRPYSAPPGPTPGSQYMFTTIRAHLPGGYIPAHFDDEQAARPSYRLLTPMIRPRLFSFVIAFSKADSGGSLEVFNIHPEAPGQRIVDSNRNAVRADLDAAEKVAFTLDPGDLIVFNSGHHLHRVTPVIGATTRWTACSFMAERSDGFGVYGWG